jgi:galactokinase/mevalonate kinase-like predicted kinase
MTPIFRARAPLRLIFAGSGTDVPPFPEKSAYQPTGPVAGMMTSVGRSG